MEEKELRELDVDELLGKKSEPKKETSVPFYIKNEEKELDELDFSEIYEPKYVPRKTTVKDFVFFGEDDREEENEYPGLGKHFLEILAEDEAKKNKENDLIGAKDYEMLLEQKRKNKEEYRPEEKKYVFENNYGTKQGLSDLMALRLGVSQEKLDEIKTTAKTKDGRNVLTAMFDHGIANTSAAITGGLDILFGGPLKALGWGNNPISTVNNFYQNRKNQKYDTMMKKADETGLGKPMKYAVEFGSNLISSVPNLLIAYISSGTSLAAQGGSALSNILNNPAFWYSFETSLYPEYENAIKNGATEKEAILTAPIASLFNAGIEVGGGIEKLPKVMQNQGMRNKILSIWTKAAIEEGNESVLQDIASELTQKIIFDQGKDWVSFDKDSNAVLNVPKSFENWITSAAVGGVLGAPTTVKSLLSKNVEDFVGYENFKKIIGDDFTYDLDSFKKMKYNEPEKWGRVNLDYSRRADLIVHPEKALPNASIATAEDSKFVEYLFNSQNASGYPKGNTITNHLGYSKDNWQDMKVEILKKANKYPAKYNGKTIYGDKYEQRIILYGPKNNPANVLVGWMVKPDGSIHLTTVFITNKGDYNK